MLRNEGFATFLPLKTEFRWKNRANRARHKKREVEYPLLPGYLFIGLNEGTPFWDRVLYAIETRDSGSKIDRRRRAVLGVIVDHAGAPYEIPHDSNGSRIGLRDLIWRYAGGRFSAPSAQRYMQTYREFEVGDQVQTLDEMMAGKVISIDDAEARVLFDFFGGEREIQVSVAKLARIQ